MQEWTDEFIRHAQHELVAMVTARLKKKQKRMKRKMKKEQDTKKIINMEKKMDILKLQ